MRCRPSAALRYLALLVPLLRSVLLGSVLLVLLGSVHLAVPRHLPLEPLVPEGLSIVHGTRPCELLLMRAEELLPQASPAHSLVVVVEVAIETSP